MIDVVQPLPPLQSPTTRFNSQPLDLYATEIKLPIGSQPIDEAYAMQVGGATSKSACQFS